MEAEYVIPQASHAFIETRNARCKILPNGQIHICTRPARLRTCRPVAHFRQILQYFRSGYYHRNAIRRRRIRRKSQSSSRTDGVYRFPCYRRGLEVRISLTTGGELLFQRLQAWRKGLKMKLGADIMGQAPGSSGGFFCRFGRLCRPLPP